MVAGRELVGADRDPDLLSALEERVATARSVLEPSLRSVSLRSLRVAQRRADGKEPGYEAEQYDIAVNTKQEQRISVLRSRRRYGDR